MRQMSSSSWQRQGSSIIFDRDVLANLIQTQPVSLREALSWSAHRPVDPPCGSHSRTVLVGGLGTCLDMLSVQEAEEFLRHRIKPMVLEFQDQWPECGLVFGISASAQTFAVSSASEELTFVRRDRKQVRLSYAMWDGSATLNVTQLLQDDKVIGYHVRRIS